MKTYFDMTPKEWSDLHGTEGGGEQLTKQADKDAADINIIVKTYGTSGQFANVNPLQPRYQDNTGVLDLIAAKNLWNEAEKNFNELPAEVRALANNDPIQFMEMMTRADDVEMLKKMGLPVAEVQPTPKVETLLETLIEKVTPKA